MSTSISPTLNRLRSSMPFSTGDCGAATDCVAGFGGGRRSRVASERQTVNSRSRLVLTFSTGLRGKRRRRHHWRRRHRCFGWFQRLKAERRRRSWGGVDAASAGLKAERGCRCCLGGLKAKCRCRCRLGGLKAERRRGRWRKRRSRFRRLETKGWCGSHRCCGRFSGLEADRRCAHRRDGRRS